MAKLGFDSSQSGTVVYDLNYLLDDLWCMLN